MDITFFNAADYNTTLRCSIQKSGKIGFTESTQSKLGLNDATFIRVGKGTNEQNEVELFMQISNDPNSGGFKLNKAGDYYYANTKALFDELSINYKDKAILYEMQLHNKDERIYKLIKKGGDTEQT